MRMVLKHPPRPACGQILIPSLKGSAHWLFAGGGGNGIGGMQFGF